MHERCQCIVGAVVRPVQQSCRVTHGNPTDDMINSTDKKKLKLSKDDDAPVPAVRKYKNFPKRREAMPGVVNHRTSRASVEISIRKDFLPMSRRRVFFTCGQCSLRDKMRTVDDGCNLDHRNSNELKISHRALL